MACIEIEVAFSVRSVVSNTGSRNCHGDLQKETVVRAELDSSWTEAVARNLGSGKPIVAVEKKLVDVIGAAWGWEGRSSG